MGGLRERDEALTLVDDVLAVARSGRGGSLFLEGDPGIGKTAVLDAAMERAGGDFVIRQAKGAAMEQGVALAFVEQVLGALAPGPSSSAHPGDRRAAVHELAWSEVQRWDRHRPTLVILDDLHWADHDSLTVIAFILRRLGRMPMAILGALRPWPPEATAVARSVAAEAAGRLVHLHPLSRPATAGLVRDLTDGPVSPTVIDRAYQLVGGNPQLVAEASRSIREGGDLPAPGTTNVRRLQRALLLSHLAGLPPEALACAQAAAIFGGPFRLAVVQAVVDQTDLVFVDSFDTLVAAGVIRDQGGGWAAFSHDLVAAALYDDMTPARRQLAHRRAFDHHAARGDPSAAAPHAVAADLVGDERAIDVLADAGERALCDGAPQTGVAHLAAAVRLAGPGVTDALHTRYADALFAADRPLDAGTAYRRLLDDSGPPGRQAALHAKLARAQAYAGRLDQALATYAALFDSVDRLEPAMIPVLAERAHVVWERDGPTAALATLEPLDSGAPLPASGVLEALRAFFRLEAGDPTGLEAIERAVPDSGRSHGAAASFNVSVLHATALGVAERFDEAAGVIDRAIAHSGGLAAWSTIGLRIARLAMLLNQGQIFAVLNGTDGIADRLELDSLNQPRVLLFRAQALTWLGRLDDAAQLLSLAGTMRGSQSWFGALSLGAARGQWLLAEGRVAEALDSYLDVEPVAELVGVGSLGSPGWAAGAMDAAWHAGRVDELARLAAWLEERMAGMPCRWPEALVVAGRAGVATAEGDASGAESLYQRYLRLPAANPLDRALVQLRYGSWLRRNHQTLRARPVLSEAAQVAEERGAALLAGRARVELAAAGGRKRANRRASALTPQESQVIDLAVGGATTREIATELYLSPRTVETHLGAA